MVDSFNKFAVDNFNKLNVENLPFKVLGKVKFQDLLFGELLQSFFNRSQYLKIILNLMIGFNRNKSSKHNPY